MLVVFESEYFQIIVPERPHVSREDGGHLIIAPKRQVEDRTKLTTLQAKELMKLTMVTGEAIRTVLASSGIDLGRINYQDNGNWRPELHIHLYGRAKSAVTQPYGTPLKFPATKEEFDAQTALEPLHKDEAAAIGEEIKRLLNTEKYKNF